MSEYKIPKNCPGKLNGGAVICIKCCGKNITCPIEGKIPSQADNQKEAFQSYKKKASGEKGGES